MQSAEKLSITLPAEMARLIRAKVKSGGYGSNSEVIREAMRGWMEREKHLATLEAKLDLAIADVDAGRVFSTEEARRALLGKLDQKHPVRS